MKTLRRSEAIEALRDVLLRMVDEQSSLCRVAAWRELFCHGFSQWSQAELERRFPTIAPRSTHFARAHQEQLVNDAQLHRQDVHARKLPCDVEHGCDAPCRGWQEFSDRDLARFHRELCGEKVRVVPDAS